MDGVFTAVVGSALLAVLGFPFWVGQRHPQNYESLSKKYLIFTMCFTGIGHAFYVGHKMGAHEQLLAAGLPENQLISSDTMSGFSFLSSFVVAILFLLLHNVALAVFNHYVVLPSLEERRHTGLAKKE